MGIIEELEWRGLISDCTDREGLAQRLAKGAVTLYCGFDPTADSLHVGSLVPLLALRRFQQFGHKPIVIAGGATGSIGDPSGKSAERQLLTHEQLKANIEGVKKQLASFLDFDSEANAALLVDNADWTAPLSFLDVLRDVGKHFKVNAMVAKESVRARMENRDVGISFTEFSYMILQALDFDHLYKQNECELQIGGSDQWALHLYPGGTHQDRKTTTDSPRLNRSRSFLPLAILSAVDLRICDMNTREGGDDIFCEVKLDFIRPHPREGFLGGPGCNHWPCPGCLDHLLNPGGNLRGVGINPFIGDVCQHKDCRCGIERNQ